MRPAPTVSNAQEVQARFGAAFAAQPARPARSLCTSSRASDEFTEESKREGRPHLRGDRQAAGAGRAGDRSHRRRRQRPVSTMRSARQRAETVRAALIAPRHRARKSSGDRTRQAAPSDAHAGRRRRATQSSRRDPRALKRVGRCAIRGRRGCYAAPTAVPAQRKHGDVVARLRPRPRTRDVGAQRFDQRRAPASAVREPASTVPHAPAP